MRNAIYISNVFGACTFWASEQQRAGGFCRHLPEFGWTCDLLVKRCNCADDGERLASPDSVGRVVRLDCRARRWYRWWLQGARRCGFRFSDDAAAREVLHLVRDTPGAPGVEPGTAQAWLAPVLPLFHALGLIVGRVHEQDRIDWVARGIDAGCRLAAERGTEVVIGSFPYVQNLEIAAGVARRLGLPWVADFRDAVLGGYCCPASLAPRVRRALRSAAMSIHTSEGYAACDASIHKGNYRVIENGYNEEEMAGARSASAGLHASKFVIRFAGTIYPQRDLSIFLAGYRLFLERVDP